MYIIEIILEGFKSYAQRTVIKDFDQQFNAVTGLNGSGKSNIMDAIMFVLGISKDWDLLRVQNIKELIYKGGHAGITKAEATIRFDNSDKKMSPMGYESCQFIVVTRQVTAEKSKYFVNGVKEQQNKVKNMFRSIQLNIDNPHFYVAQGRITKIINLKSQELISMIEETAGTALYNEKKKESNKIILKKEEKVAEINDLIEKDIYPQISKLRTEREQYLLWKGQETELIRLTKLLKSYEYFSKDKIKNDRIKLLDNLKIVQQDQKIEQQELRKQLNNVEAQIAECKKHYNSEQNEQFKKNETKLNEEKQQLAKRITEIESRKKRIAESERELIKIEKEKLENENGIVRAEDKIKFFQDSLSNLQQTLKEKKEQQDEAQTNVDQMKQGQISSEDAKSQLLNNINSSKAHLQQAQYTIKSLKDQVRHLEREIEIQSQNFQNMQQEGKDREKQISILEKESKEIEDEINHANFDEMRIGELREYIQNKNNSIMQINHQIDLFTQGRNWIFKLQYRDPESNFNRKRVRGRLFTLFEQKSGSEHNFLKALEAGAGARLQNVVVDNEVTASLLLKQRCFDFRVNLVPNNKISTFTPNRQIRELAERIAYQHQGFAIPAYEVINFDEMNRNAILYAFGGFLICSDDNIAKKIANNPQVNMRYRCVTIEGDVYDSSGTLSGGYNDTSNMLLVKYAELQQLQKQCQMERSELNRLQEEYDQMRKDEDYYNGLRHDLEQKQKKLEYLQNQFRRQSEYRMQDKTENLKLKISDLLENEKRTEIQCQQYEKEIQELQEEYQSFSGSTNLKDVYSNKIKKLKSDISQLSKQINTLKSDISKQEVEKDTCESNLKKVEKQKIKDSKNLEIEKSQIQVDEGALRTHKEALKELQKQKEQFEKDIDMYNQQSQKLQDEKSSISKDLQKAEDDIKKSEAKSNKIAHEVKNISDQLGQLEKNFDWIPECKKSFGVPSTEFDYTNFNYENQSSKYHELKIDQDKLSKKVNFKVEAMSDNVEKNFQNLKEKREKLTQDKFNLQNNMDELDKKRQITLEKCYMTVNENFGKIFSDLLPNAFAKLSPLEGKHISEGLELSVKLGKAWRNSLSELSGGQRSLLALSFVLSLLLYKPAPFYILDEVDAALDLSHTENIGHMIAQRFPQSQFLIISHKDGMYQNANVLFKTSIVDGNSRIDRFQFQSKNRKQIKK